MSKIEAWAVVDKDGQQYSDLCDTRKEASDQIRCAKLEFPEDSWRIVRLVPESEAATANGAERTLRDWFAGQALTGLVSKAPLRDAKGEYGPQFNLDELTEFRRCMAVSAYDYADAMLARRERLAAQPEKEAE